MLRGCAFRSFHRRKDEKPKVRLSESFGGRYCSNHWHVKIRRRRRGRHPQFGDGTITDIEGEKLTIKFADERTKQIVLAVAAAVTGSV